VAQSTKPPSSYYSADLRRLCLLPLHAENLKSLLFDLLSHPLPAIRHPLKLTIDAEVSASRSVAPLGSFIRDIRQSTIFLSANRSTPSAIRYCKCPQNDTKFTKTILFFAISHTFFAFFHNFSHFFQSLQSLNFTHLTQNHPQISCPFLNLSCASLAAFLKTAVL
jgi:hypothetical protein